MRQVVGERGTKTEDSRGHGRSDVAQSRRGGPWDAWKKERADADGQSRRRGELTAGRPASAGTGPLGGGGGRRGAGRAELEKHETGKDPASGCRGHTGPASAMQLRPDAFQMWPLAGKDRPRLAQLSVCVPGLL